MKKLTSFITVIVGLFAGSAVYAQKDITSVTATKEKGYEVLNPGESITLYKYQHPSHPPKEAEKYAPKYFFTTASPNILQELTRTNLKKAFPESHAFHDALDVNFREDKELINYDDFHKTYKLNRVYSTTIKQ